MGTVKALCDKGIIPLEYDVKQSRERGETISLSERQPLFMGQIAGLVDKVMPAREIVEELVRDAITAMQNTNKTIVYSSSKL